ncbi:hypothetical protein EVAR_13957_1 [Eumeta japonica]|uniref:Uncharacterized protein n=1 Tax=Eumeta variegata TaxID=151549 RepID=A0A4C1U9V8_EUMVA|nr:hypothetical protein EVAR_13957_1 [Eumeta japonica]
MKAECEHSLASMLPQKYLGQYFRQRQVQWKGLSVNQRWLCRSGLRANVVLCARHAPGAPRPRRPPRPRTHVVPQSFLAARPAVGVRQPVVERAWRNLRSVGKRVRCLVATYCELVVRTGFQLLFRS